VTHHLSVVKVKQVIDAIFAHIIQDLHIENVAVPERDELYWDILLDSSNVADVPEPRIGVGKLSDDWEFLESILDDREQAVSLMLIHVAPLLRYVGTKIGQ